MKASVAFHAQAQNLAPRRATALPFVEGRWLAGRAPLWAALFVAAALTAADATNGSASAAPTASTAPTTSGGGSPKGKPSGFISRVSVAAGPFVRGSARGDDDERPVRNQKLPAFSIDRTEVTRLAYAACVVARRCKAVPPQLAGSAGMDGSLPVTGVSWFDARDFCAFSGGRLPSEAEWEKAARGTEGRQFPWGSEPLCDLANWGNFEGEGPCAIENPGFPVSVGRYPHGASPYGALDMAGNVWEWVADRYDEDPRRRVVRGGSCCSYFVPPWSSNRNAWTPEYRDGDLGFRCVAGRGR